MTPVVARVRRTLARLMWPAATSHRDARRVVCHEWLAVLGGSDKVAAELVDVTDAEVMYTFAVTDECVAAVGAECPVVTWRFGRWAGRSRRFTVLLPFMPIVWWALDLERAEHVVTSSHACVNAIRSPNATRLSYCHTPMRYAWAWRLERGRLPVLLRPTMPVGAAILRWFDRRWSRRVDAYVANSTVVRDRIATAYGVDADVVHPPIDTGRFTPGAAPTADAPFVAAGRFVAYKRFDLAIDAAGRAGVPLVVAGDGPEIGRLRAMAGPTVSFVPAPSDEALLELLRGARAFLFPGIEDFGMLPVEAQACGCPVIARRAGGALDSVIDGLTGRLLDDDDPTTWAAALSDFSTADFDRDRIVEHAARFGVDTFRAGMHDVIGRATVGTPR